ncbi:hypothetical protein NQ318_017815 [Aromia moschata]|uniref:THAP-type domain-containing protein n=1 Tax=Aromia moschata TaxID=1265417 RepID=A0AAV8YGH9_9CUCU|nr:hypothetical protein NQ318_017815 [Aromia moschata]
MERCRDAKGSILKARKLQLKIKLHIFYGDFMVTNSRSILYWCQFFMVEAIKDFKRNNKAVDTILYLYVLGKYHRAHCDSRLIKVCTYEVCKLNNYSGNVTPDLARLWRWDLEGRCVFALKMPSSCSVPGCNSVTKAGSIIKFHPIPKDEGLRHKWLKAIKKV